MVTCFPQATILGDVDNLLSPSAAIVLGKRVKCGTGAFELKVQLPPLPAEAKEGGGMAAG